METAAILYHLQQAELQRAESASGLARAKASLQDDSLVTSATAATQQSQAALTQAQAAARSLELDVQSVKTKLRGSQERLFSGKVSNPKELASLQDEGEALGRRIAKLEDDLLEAMIAVEDAQAQHDRASASLADASARRAAEVADLTRRQAELEQRIIALDADIAGTRSSLPADALSLYDHLARRKANRPVALLGRSNACGACGVSVPLAAASQTRAHEEIVICPSCERILYSQG